MKTKELLLPGVFDKTDNEKNSYHVEIAPDRNAHVVCIEKIRIRRDLEKESNAIEKYLSRFEYAER